MSAVSSPPSLSSNSSSVNAGGSTRRWIINSWVDAVFIVLTPLVAIPAILFFYSPWVGVRAETISLVVAAFFATGHHLPGLIRAYGDRELFSRFRWRFLLAPPIVFLAYFPLHTYHFSLYRLIILSWATWHGLMQLYGFVRIYDAKVGSVSRRTAYWDWLLCLCGFVTPQVLRPEQLSNIIGHWYASGGAWVPSTLLSVIRWSTVAFSIAVFIGFTVNFLIQRHVGPKPSLLKVFMLASGIGMWWYAMLAVDNLLIGIALFDICHDLQYLAIVWLYNRRRVEANPDLGGFMSYVFRRGMVMVYVGLILVYGASALIPPLLLEGKIQTIAYAVLFTSTILHYYYDGFIWKVRESANQASLDLVQDPARSRWRSSVNADSWHLAKCAPVLAGLGFLFAMDFLDPPLTTAQTNDLEKKYVETLMGNSALPAGEEEKSWLYSRFEQVQNLAAVIPDDQAAQVRAAIMLANFGRNAEAVQKLEALITEHPNVFNAKLMLGGILYYLGETDRAATLFEAAAGLATTPEELSAAYRKWGEVDLDRSDFASADRKFKIAIENDPASATYIDQLRKSHTRRVETH